MKKIPLYQKGKIVAWSLVDDEDYERFSFKRWNLSPFGYARSKYRKDNIEATCFLHRFIMNAQPGTILDHINGDKLDNRKSNLRFCTTSQNGYNRKRQKNNISGHAGIGWNKQFGKWKARIRRDQTPIYEEHFDDFDEAVREYRKNHKQLIGEFSPY